MLLRSKESSLTSKNDRCKSVKRSLHEYGRENVQYIYISDSSLFCWVHQYQNIENKPRTIKRKTLNAKQGLRAAVAKQRRLLPNVVIFI